MARCTKATEPPAGEIPQGTDLEFEEPLLDYSVLLGFEFTPRGSTNLHYRHCLAESGTAVILLHGSGGHSRHFLTLAKHLGGKEYAQVFALDLRGHGGDPARLGDLDYTEQLEDELMDLIAGIRETYSITSIVIGERPSGGLLALRVAGGRHAHDAQAHLLLPSSATTCRNADGWPGPYTRRTTGYSILSGFGIR